MEDPRDTVRKIIAFALDPAANENEARNMAMKACRLIERHRLLDAPTAPSPARPRAARAADRAAHQAMMDELFDTLFSNNPYATRPDPADYNAPAQPPPQPTVHGSATKKRAKDPDARLLTVLQATWCPGCGQKLRYGSFATWSRGEVWHSSCLDQVSE